MECWGGSTCLSGGLEWRDDYTITLHSHAVVCREMMAENCRGQKVSE